MTRKLTILFVPLVLLLGCNRADPVVDVAAEARRIAQTSIIVDTHIDLPMRLHSTSPDISQPTANIEYFHDRGTSYIALAHGKSNHISDSSYDPNHQWNGLSEFGMQVVKDK